MIKPKDVVEAICCERLSYSEASLVFSASEFKLRSIIANECERTGLLEKDLWQSIGKPSMTTSRVAERPRGRFMALARLQRSNKLSYFVLKRELKTITRLEKEEISRKKSLKNLHN